MISDPHHDFIDPAIAANALGDVIIGFTGTGDATTADYPGSWYVACTTAAGVTTRGTPRIRRNGASPYDLGIPNEVRWGGYSAISIDPTNSNTFWIANEVAVTGDPRHDISWGTQISALTFTDADHRIPEPGTLARLWVSLAGIAALRRRRAA